PGASPADIRRIAHDADGNPLFVEELVAALGTTGVPQTVRDLMLARFSGLDEPSRHLVRTAAVIGATAPQAWLAAAAGLDESATRGAARAAVDRGLLIAAGDGTSYHFRHALLRQAVLDELLPDERVALHHAIAAALTVHPAVAVGIDRIAELARHWHAARDASSALRWLVAAAEQAEQGFAFEAAFDDYELALGWWESVDDAPAVAGIDHAALLLDAADAAGLAGRIGHAAHLASAWCYEAFGDFERVEAEYERAAEIARNANAPSMLALVLYNHAAFKTDFPDLQGSVTLLDEVDALVERFGLRRYLVVSRC